jgi:uncharacterized surface protein with fasciclin (FAS1) repeats
MNVRGRATAIAVAGLAALSLAACSSSTEDSATASAMATSQAPAPEMTSEPVTEGTIADLAASSSGLSTLAAALDAAGLTETLQGAGPFTVFAPSDDAFAALPPGLLDALLLPENKDALTKILTYHVVPGTVMAADVMDGDVATVEGQSITLSTTDGVTVNGATVLEADITADNGVIHVIDAVLLPPDVDPNALLSK